MKKNSNIAHCLQQREADPRFNYRLRRDFVVTDEFINRLGLHGELDGHTGCVNCLEWSENGRLLASGSDDVHVNIWDPFQRKQLTSISTGHQGNIFSVKFVPCCGNSQIISGAADHSVRIYDLQASEIMSVCSCHSGRVKRLATDHASPYLFWSAGEDGLILQHDLRTPHTCSSSDTSFTNPINVLLDLKSYTGSKAEAKCLAVNPVRSEMMVVGANDPYVRMYDRRMLKIHYTGTSDLDSNQAPRNAVQYFVPGHLPTKVTEYRRRYRSLAATYVTFNADGSEILVNLGGEQIYLFPVVPVHPEGFSWFSVPRYIPGKETKEEHQHTNGYKNGHISPIVSGDVGACPSDSKDKPQVVDKVPLPPHVETLKEQANAAFKENEYGKAIHIYNEALRICPESVVLLGNRGAALLKRSWDGDVYAALRDCSTAMAMEPDHFKAHLRTARCLFELSHFPEAIDCLQNFKKKFPSFITTYAYKHLDEDLAKLKSKSSSSSSPPGGSGSGPSPGPASSPPLSSSPSSMNSESSNLSTSTGSISTASSSSTVPISPPPSANSDDNDNDNGPTRNFFIRFSSNSESSNSNDNVENDTEEERERARALSAANFRIGVTGGAVPGETKPHAHPPKRLATFHEIETEFQGKAYDFTERFCGHCNTTTDIKEANFFGRDYIVAGSDDGSFFIWDRRTTNIVKVLKGDESIVNCLQPHPSLCFMATSGIETIIRLWSPLAEEGVVNDRIVDDWTTVASANQKRMNTNPFEMILMNMGYRVTPDDDTSDGDPPHDSSVQCSST